MSQPTIVATWKDETRAWVAMSIENGDSGNIEYNGSTPLLDEQGNAKNDETLVREAYADAQRLREAQFAAVWQPAIPTL